MRTHRAFLGTWVLLAGASAGCSSDEPAAPQGGTGGSAGTGGAAAETGGRGGATGGAGGGAKTGGAGGAAGSPETGGAKFSSGGAADGGPEASSGGTQPTDGGDSGDGATGAKAALHVDAIDAYIEETSTAAVPVDLTQYDLSVLVYDATTKKFSTHPPTSTDLGTFEVATLPAGDRYVRYSQLGAAPSYYVTSSDVLDLGGGVFGRPDAVVPTSATTLVLNVANMESWQAGDTLEFISLGAGTFFSNAEFKMSGAPVSGAPNPGDTSLTALTIEYSSRPGAKLVDGTKGDKAYLVHLSTRSMAGGGSYLAMSDVFSLPTVTFADGQTTTVSGAFTKPTGSSVDVDWKGSQFDAEATACAPGAPLGPWVLGGAAQPAPESGFVTASPDTFLFSPAAGTDLATTFAFNNSFSPKWPVYVGAETHYVAHLALPSTQPIDLEGQVSVRVLAPGAVTIQPLVGCAKNITIAGQSVTGNITGVGLSPAITFDAPSIGTPAGYQIDVYRLFDSAGTTDAAVAGRVVAAGRSILLPPGIMTTGNAYVFRFASIGHGTIDMNQQPRRLDFPGSYAATYSGIVRP